MIKDLIQSGPNINVQATVQPYINNNNSMNQYSGVSAGQLRFNLQSQCIEVFDGMTWNSITTTATVDLSMSANEAINWVRAKMEEERTLKLKMEKYPALKDAYEHFKVIESLVHGEEETA